MADRSGDPVIEIEHLQGFYGDSQVLHGVDLSVRPGETVAIIGRNGAGKTTTLRAIMGILERRRGSIRIFGMETIDSPPESVARLGVGYVPEERGIYATLSVAENLILPPVLKPGGMTMDEIYRLFQNLWKHRKSQATRLSGGEQQMLAIARVLRTGASLLLLDEPTEGLAPVIVEQIEHLIGSLKERGHTTILVEQNFRVAARLADRHIVMESGRTIDVVAREEALGNPAKLQAYLGV